MRRAKVKIIERDASRPPWHVNERGCWISTAGFLEKQGYRMFSLLGRLMRAHRVAYLAVKGAIPKGGVVRHVCDDPQCINPAHLLLGTKRDNTRDMLARGRASDWQDRPGRKGHYARQKLTLRAIGEIRLSQESSYALSERYAVSAVQIRRIRNGSRCASL